MSEISDISNTKRTYKIALMGSYEDCCISKLNLLKHHLQGEGYILTSIAADLSDTSDLVKTRFTKPMMYDFEKSMNAIVWASLIFFVFFKDCNFNSMLTEISEAIHTYQKSSSIEFLFENGADIRNVNLGWLGKYNLTRNWFRDEIELYEYISARTWSKFYEYFRFKL